MQRGVTSLMGRQQLQSHSTTQRLVSAQPTRQKALLLLLGALLVTAQTAGADDRGVFTADSFKSDMSLSPATKSRKAGPNHTVGPVPAGVAWDGANLWTAAGGATDTVNLVRWSKSGHSIKAAHTPNLDIRAIWTQAQGPEVAMYADVYDDDKVYVRNGDGTFKPTGVSLQGATKDTDSPVLFRPNSLPEDPVAGVLVAHDGAGALLEFDASDGKFIRDIALNGYGAEPGETDWPAYTRFAVADVGPDGRFLYLTYAGSRVHAWDSEGRRVGGATLESAGEDEMSCHSFSYANGRAWILDTNTGSWMGYKLEFTNPAPRQRRVKQRQQEAKKAPGNEDNIGDSGNAGPVGDVQAEEVCPLAVE